MEKGQVEKNVQDARNRMWQVMPVFKDLAKLNQWLEDRCIALWDETPHKVLPGSIAPSHRLLRKRLPGSGRMGG